MLRIKQDCGTHGTQERAKPNPSRRPTTNANAPGAQQGKPPTRRTTKQHQRTNGARQCTRKWTNRNATNKPHWTMITTNCTWFNSTRWCITTCGEIMKLDNPKTTRRANVIPHFIWIFKIFLRKFARNMEIEIGNGTDHCMTVTGWNLEDVGPHVANGIETGNTDDTNMGHAQLITTTDHTRQHTRSAAEQRNMNTHHKAIQEPKGQDVAQATFSIITRQSTREGQWREQCFQKMCPPIGILPRVGRNRCQQHLIIGESIAEISDQSGKWISKFNVIAER